MRLKVIESPCRREPTVAGQQREKQIRQIDTESDKMREEDEGDGFIQSDRGKVHVILSLSNKSELHHLPC